MTLIDDLQGFLKGAAAFRNAREWAKEQRKTFVAKANSAAGDADDGAATSYLKNTVGDELSDLASDSSTGNAGDNDTSTPTIAPLLRHGRRSRDEIGDDDMSADEFSLPPIHDSSVPTPLRPRGSRNSVSNERAQSRRRMTFQNNKSSESRTEGNKKRRS